MAKKKKEQTPSLLFDGIWFENGQVLARITTTKEPPHEVILLDRFRSLEEGENLLEEFSQAVQEWIDAVKEGEDGDKQS